MASRLVFCLLFLLSPAARVRAEDPVFLARTLAGKELRGPLVGLAEDGSAEIGRPVRRKVAAGELLSLRQAGTSLPALPSDEHLVLADGSRIPFQDLRLEDEKLIFRHGDLDGNKDVKVSLTTALLIWRMAPDGVLTPARLRHQLLRGSRSSDHVLLRNGDRVEGTLESIGDTVSVEVNKKPVKVRWSQVAAIALNTELADRPRLPELSVRAVVSASDAQPGGRFTLTGVSSDGSHFQGKTTFGAALRVPVERLVGLEVQQERVVPLVELKPSRYEYRPFLDERWWWSANANVTLGDLTVGRSTYARGIGMHAHSLLRYSLDGKYRRFEALVGLDSRDGRRGKVRVRVLVDGKPADLGKVDVLTQASGAVPVRVELEGAKELTLEVIPAQRGPVQAVVNWVDAVLVR